MCVSKVIMAEMVEDSEPHIRLCQEVKYFNFFEPAYDSTQMGNGRVYSSQVILLRLKKSRKSQGILPKILEKSEKIILENFKKYWKSLGNWSACDSENPARMVQYLK